MVEGTAKRVEFLLYGHFIIAYPTITIDRDEKIIFLGSCTKALGQSIFTNKHADTIQQECQ